MTCAKGGVYVLELQAGYFYIGHSKDVNKRIHEHTNRPNAWISQHGPIKTQHLPETASRKNLLDWERDETLWRMMSHNPNRVRGWEFTSSELSDLDKKQLRLSSWAVWARACAESAGEKDTSPVRVERPLSPPG